MIIEHVKTVLAEQKRVYVEYDQRAGYERAGFVWLQGFNDLVDRQTYPKGNESGGYNEYSQLLAHLIRDIRKDLSARKMPFVIGVMGVGGLEANPGMRNFREAMTAPSLMPEFKGNVFAVPTAPFVPQELVDIDLKRAQKRSLTADQKALWKRAASNAGYHYHGCAKTFAEKILGK